MLSVLFSVVNLALISLHPLLINTSAFANLVNLRISILPHYLPKKNWIGTWTWQNNHSFQLTLPTTCIFAQNKLRELGEGWWFVKSGIIQISELLSMAGFSWGVEWGQICQDPLSFCGRRPAWAAGALDLDENRGDLSKRPDGIDVAQESAGERFKVEWDFQERERSKSLSIRDKEIYIWKEQRLEINATLPSPLEKQKVNDYNLETAIIVLAAHYFLLTSQKKLNVGNFPKIFLQQDKR